MSSRSVLLKNFAALLCSEFIVRIAASLGAILIARTLGPKQYGILVVALSYSFIAGYLCDLGLTHLTLQQSAVPEVDLCVLLSTMLKVRLVLTATVTVASLAWIIWVYTNQESRLVMLLVILPSIWGISLSGFASSYFWLQQKLYISAAIKTIGQLLMAVTLLISFLLKLQVVWVAAGYGAVSLIGGAIAMWMFRRQGQPIGGWETKLVRGLGGFTLSGIAAMALPQVGPILLQRVTDGAQLGCFAAASRIPSALCAIPGAVGTAWYPQLFQLGINHRAGHLEKCAQEIKIIAILGIGLALPLYLYPALIIRSLLGSSWVNVAAPVLSTLCWMTVLNSVSNPLGDALATKGLQMRKAVIYALALLLGVVLYSYFGKTAGALGGARAAVMTQAALCVGLVLVNPTGLRLVATVLRKLVGSLIIASAAGVAVRWALPVNLLSAALVFFGFFCVIAVADKELRQIGLWGINQFRRRLERA
jgi:O-antigen/teichoic acid export membrane protein